MSLTMEMVEQYLLSVPSLRDINNHDVKDKDGWKTNQTPLTIELGKFWIEDVLQRYYDDELQLTTDEVYSLNDLESALNEIPTSIGFCAMKSLIMGLDGIQKSLFDAVSQYVNAIEDIDIHKNIVKAIVLVLKILEYDLSKEEGPIVRKIGFWPKEILSNEKRIENHAIVSKLLTDIIAKFNHAYLQNEVCSAANAAASI